MSHAYLTWPRSDPNRRNICPVTIAADAIEPGEFEQGHKLFMRPFDHDLGVKSDGNWKSPFSKGEDMWDFLPGYITERGMKS